MTETIKMDAFSDLHSEFQVDFRKALEISKTLDNEDNYERNELPLEGTPVVLLLGIYGALAHKASSKPKNQKLAVVVWPPHVFFCPSMNGQDGVFVEPYSEEKHGESCFVLHKELDIWGFSSVDAVRDGWTFNAAMIDAGAGRED